MRRQTQKIAIGYTSITPLNAGIGECDFSFVPGAASESSYGPNTRVRIEIGMGNDIAEVEQAVAAADIRVLLLAMFQLTGDEHWLSYSLKRDVKLIADEDAGLSSDDQHRIRAAALKLFSTVLDRKPAIADPGNALMQRMMSACLGEEVPPEYAPLMREELGFTSRDIGWTAKPVRIDSLPVLIVGAGVSGIALGARLGRLGLPYVIVERNADVGGVWHENRYPGAGVDTPNHSYSYSFGSTYPWSRYFSTRDEIYDYLQRSADEFGVRPHIHFGTAVRSARWDEAAQHWSVEVTGPDGDTTMQARALVSAIGQFGVPVVPSIAGAESYGGPAFHSANWPEGLDVSGKRVAIIGTGASAMQIVPTIIDRAASVTVFQRTPQWARPVARYHESIGAAQWLLDHVPLYAAWFRFTMWWRYGDGLLGSLRRDPDWPHPERAINRRNDRHREEMLAHISSELGSREDLIAKCTPDYPPYAKRILLDNGWYQAILKPQAELVGDPISAIMPDGVRTADGIERSADLIIYATGFEVTAMASRLNVIGTGGINLADAWEGDDPKAYLGITVPGFPNLFMMGGPNTGLGHGGSTIFQAESQARYISGMLVRMLESNVAAVDVKPEALQRFVAEVDRRHSQLIWSHPGVSTYYRNKRGRVVTVMPFRLVDYWRMTRDPDLGAYNVIAASTI